MRMIQMKFIYILKIENDKNIILHNSKNTNIHSIVSISKNSEYYYFSHENNYGQLKELIIFVLFYLNAWFNEKNL